MASTFAWSAIFIFVYSGNSDDLQTQVWTLQFHASFLFTIKVSWELVRQLFIYYEKVTLHRHLCNGI